MEPRTAVTLGNFDGLHRGHAALIAAARAAVGPEGRVVVLAFDPHPAAVLRPDARPARLTTLETRRRCAIEVGADELLPLEPTRERLGQTPNEFLDDLVREHRPDVIVEGPDFRFGRARAGDVETLRLRGRDLGFDTVVVDPVDVALGNQQLVRVSSTMIRRLVAAGRVGDARRLLGRPYALEGAVVRGEQRGRTIHIPTANLDPGDLLLPADGVYAGVANGPDGRVRPAAISVGRKPTFGEHARLCETHLVDYDGPVDRYEWPMTVRFHHWLRDQVRYDGVDALIDQLQRDIARTRELAQRDHAAA